MLALLQRKRSWRPQLPLVSFTSVFRLPIALLRRLREPMLTANARPQPHLPDHCPSHLCNHWHSADETLHSFVGRARKRRDELGSVSSHASARQAPNLAHPGRVFLEQSERLTFSLIRQQLGEEHRPHRSALLGFINLLQLGLPHSISLVHSNAQGLHFGCCPHYVSLDGPRSLQQANSDRGCRYFARSCFGQLRRAQLVSMDVGAAAPTSAKLCDVTACSVASCSSASASCSRRLGSCKPPPTSRPPLR